MFAACATIVGLSLLANGDDDWGPRSIPDRALVRVAPLTNLSARGSNVTLVVHAIDADDLPDEVQLRLVNGSAGDVEVAGTRSGRAVVDELRGAGRSGLFAASERDPAATLVVPAGAQLAITAAYCRTLGPTRYGVRVRRAPGVDVETVWSDPIARPALVGTEPRLVPARFFDDDRVRMRIENPTDELLRLSSPDSSQKIERRADGEVDRSVRNGDPPRIIQIAAHEESSFIVALRDRTGQFRVTLFGGPNHRLESDWFERPDDHVPLTVTRERGVAITFDRLEPDYHRTARVRLRLENPTDEFVMFRGTSATTPDALILAAGAVDATHAGADLHRDSRPIGLSARRAVPFDVVIRDDVEFAVELEVVDELGHGRVLRSEFFPSPWGRER